MSHELHLSRRWRICWILDLPLSIACGLGMFTEGFAWWKAACCAGMMWSAAFQFWMLRRATGAPLVSITPDEIAWRPMVQEVPNRLLREDVRGIGWSTSYTICVNVRSGPPQNLILTGLTRKDKDAVRAQLESWVAAA